MEEYKKILELKGKEKQIRKPLESVLPIIGKTEIGTREIGKPHNTQEIVAEKLGWSTTNPRTHM